MYHWVEDKEFLKRAYRDCADIVNQFVQNLRNYEIEAGMNVVGSKSRNMVTQNANEPIDFDFNVVIFKAPNINDCRAIKENAMLAFNEVLRANGWENCSDSTSAMTTKYRSYKDGNRTKFSIDICLVKMEGTAWYRLIHHKTGNIYTDSYVWEIGKNSQDIKEKVHELKSIPGAWNEVRDTYLHKKNQYCAMNDHNHSSFICYIEAVNEVYYAKVSTTVLIPRINILGFK